MTFAFGEDVVLTLERICQPVREFSGYMKCSPKLGQPVREFSGYLKRSPKLGQPVLEFSGFRLMPAGAPMSHSTAISAPDCRSRCVAELHCSLYANPPFSAVRRQGSGTNACSSIRF